MPLKDLGTKQVTLHKQTVWGDIFFGYISKNQFTPKIALSRPLYIPGKKDFQGVSSFVFNLGDIQKFLQSLKIGKTGQVVIIDKSGNLIGTSDIKEETSFYSDQSPSQTNTSY